MRFKRFIQNCTLSLGLLLASASATAESPRNLEDILSKPSQEKHEVSSDVLDLDKKVKDYNRNTIQPKLNERERRRRAAELERQKKEEEKRYLSSLGEKLPNLTEYILLKKDNYNISFEIKIEKGGVLEIEPGTRLSFMPNCGIVCYGGRLVAKGTPRDKITFRATEKRWGNITLVGTRSFLEDCVITEGSGRAEKDVLFGWYYKGGPKVMLSDKDIRIGGGLLLVNDGSFVRDCEIYGNNAEKGGGVYLKSTGSERFRSEAIFDNNIHDNTA